MTPPTILISDHNSFITKYIERQLQDSPLHPQQKIVHAGTDMSYDLTIDVTDSRITIEGTHRATVILMLPAVVGTGMGGELGRMAAMINRGTYFHVSGDDARLSVIHATDVGKAVAIALSNPSITGTYHISDGINPTWHDLAEALAYRMGQKRIYSLTLKRWQRMARWADRLKLSQFGSRQLKLITTDAIVDTNQWTIDAGEAWHPTDTTEYLRTHVYDENSL